MLALTKPGWVALLVITGLLNDKNGDSRAGNFHSPILGLNVKECVYSQELNAKAGVKLHDTWPSSPPQRDHGRPKDTPRFRL